MFKIIFLVQLQIFDGTNTVETDTVIDKIWHEHRFVFFILSELNTLAKFHYLSDTNLFYLIDGEPTGTQYLDLSS